MIIEDAVITTIQLMYKLDTNSIPPTTSYREYGGIVELDNLYRTLSVRWLSISYQTLVLHSKHQLFYSTVAVS